MSRNSKAAFLFIIGVPVFALPLALLSVSVLGADVGQAFSGAIKYVAGIVVGWFIFGEAT